MEDPLKPSALPPRRLPTTGFIGCGNMAGTVLRGLLQTGALAARDVVVSTRTPQRVTPLCRDFPGLTLAASNRETALLSRLLFLGVGTSQVFPVLEDLGPDLSPETHVVFLSGGLEIASVERLHRGPITKIIPTLVAEIQAGVTLVCHNARVPSESRAALENLLGAIGGVKVIQEHQFELASDFTSCAPGLLAGIFDEFVRAGGRHGDLGYAESAALFLETIRGTAELLLGTGESFEALTRRVATPGGATEGGLTVLRSRLPEVFDQVFAVIEDRHEARKQATRRQFGTSVAPTKETQ